MPPQRWQPAQTAPRPKETAEGRRERATDLSLPELLLLPRGARQALMLLVCCVGDTTKAPARSVVATSPVAARPTVASTAEAAVIGGFIAARRARASRWPDVLLAPKLGQLFEGAAALKKHALEEGGVGVYTVLQSAKPLHKLLHLCNMKKISEQRERERERGRHTRGCNLLQANGLSLSSASATSGPFERTAQGCHGLYRAP